MSHRASFPCARARSERGAGAGVTGFSGCTVFAVAEPLGRGRQGEAGEQHDTETKSGQNRVPAITVNAAAELLPIFTGETSQISAFRTSVSAFLLSTEVTVF